MYAPVYDVTPLVMPVMLRTKWRNLHAEVMAPVYDVTPLVMPIMLRTNWRNLHAEVKAPVPGQMKPPVSMMGMGAEPFPTTYTMCSIARPKIVIK